MKEFIHSLLSEAFVKAKEGGELKTSDLPPLAIEVPKDPAHGDLASNVALVLARSEGRPPRQIAETLQRHLRQTRRCRERHGRGPGLPELQARAGILVEAARGGTFGRSALRQADRGTAAQDTGRVRKRQSDRPAHRRARAQCRARRLDRAPARGVRSRGRARVLLQQCGSADAGARRIGACPLPRTSRSAIELSGGRLPRRLHPRDRRRPRGEARRHPRRRDRSQAVPAACRAGDLRRHCGDARAHAHPLRRALQRGFALPRRLDRARARRPSRRRRGLRQGRCAVAPPDGARAYR